MEIPTLPLNGTDLSKNLALKVLEICRVDATHQLYVSAIPTYPSAFCPLPAACCLLPCVKLS